MLLSGFKEEEDKHMDNGGTEVKRCINSLLPLYEKDVVMHGTYLNAHV